MFWTHHLIAVSFSQIPWQHACASSVNITQCPVSCACYSIIRLPFPSSFVSCPPRTQPAQSIPTQAFTLKKIHRVYLFLISRVLCLHVCMCTTSVPGAHREQKWVLDPWGLKLWIILNHHACAGSHTQVLWKNNKYSYP